MADTFVMNYTVRSRQMLARAAEAADADQAKRIGTHHFLLAIFGSASIGEQVLKNLGVTEEAVRAEVGHVMMPKLGDVRLDEVLETLGEEELAAKGT